MEPLAMKTKAPSSENDPNLGEKICIVCSIGSEVKCYHLYIVDLLSDNVTTNYLESNFDPTVKKNPTFIFGNDFPCDAICAIGSTLYLFDDSGSLNKYGRGRSVYTYKLPSNIENFRLERYMLTKIPDTHEPKERPVAIVTPDRKNVLVFSSRITRAYEVDFEMFVPDANGGVGLWRKFVGMPDHWKAYTMYNDQICIRNWAFINRHVLVLQTDPNRYILCTLDIRYPDQPCQKLPNKNRFAPPFENIYGQFVVVYKKGENDDESEDMIADESEEETENETEDECDDDDVKDESGDENEDDYLLLVGGQLKLAPELAYDKFDDLFYYPEFGNKYISVKGDFIVLLYLDNSECKFCTVQGYSNRKTIPGLTLTVNVYKLDLQEYEKIEGTKMEKEDEEEEPRLIPATEIIKSFKFLLTPKLKQHTFILVVRSLLNSEL